ncbi:MAG: hypothetical protein M3327_13980 [Actinomycetota bacterium]|nr:hypothetical protein [Actinomycetota bacterium]
MVAEVIPTKVHGVIDYATSGALLAAPELFRLKEVRRSALAPRLAGAAATAYSAFTDYELGLVKALPMKAHLALDAAGGGLLAASPWALGYRRYGVRHWLPHTLVGLSELAVALISKSDSDGNGRRGVGKKALVAVGIAAPLAGAFAIRRRRSRNGDGEPTSPTMTSAEEPTGPAESTSTPEPPDRS